MDQETQPKGAPVSALHSPTGKAAPNATKRKGSGTTGHYADPMSPIASTPMKRQRIRNPGERGGDLMALLLQDQALTVLALHREY